MAVLARRSKSLSGSWHGLYRYSWGRTVPFLAQLSDHVGAINGDTVEPKAAGRFSFRTASVAGNRSGNRVRFIKTYLQPSSDHYWPIQYSGLLSDDGNTILGRWLVEGVIGTFAMHREIAAEEEETATVGASRGLELRRLAPVDGRAR